mmetsp:Transcript_18051/g.34217  ORF Transcript_18051/g.34217 Transcript_18051/m.34217 type:complete len:595 (-) Transcript_18051:23-1807(-)
MKISLTAEVTVVTLGLFLFVGSLLATKVVAATVTADGASLLLESLDAASLYDENGKLASHHLVTHPACDDDDDESSVRTFTSPLYQVHVAGGELKAQLFPNDDDNDESSSKCQAVCLQRGTDQSVATAVMPHMRYSRDGGENDQSFADWFRDTCSAVESCFMNYYTDRNGALKLYWIHPDTGERKPHMAVKYGERNTRCFNTYLGHQFVAETEQGETVGPVVTIEFATVLGFGKSPPSDDPGRHHFDEEIEQTLHSEWTRHERVSRTFSPLGFAKGRLPDDVFAYLGAFYYNNRHNKVMEEWNGKGVFVNWWESDVYFIQIPWKMKELIQIRLLDMVQAWAGVPVEQTVMYGLRQYETGARLLTHVDRHVTHAVSLIVNIAQGNLTEPWPVEVQDHADRLHEVIMEPGDVVYYESAKALHARNRPMQGNGAYYVNLFTHYRPVGDDKWYGRRNPEGTPTPVLDVEGTCRLASQGLTATEVGHKQQLGVVQAVQCDDPRLGNTISPTFFQARGPDDLVQWWRYTNPHMKTDVTQLNTFVQPPSSVKEEDDTVANLQAKLDYLTELVEQKLAVFGNDEGTTGNDNEGASQSSSDEL